MAEGKIFVGNLSFRTEDRSLYQAFERYGPLREAKVMTDRETGRSRGFAFVTFASAEDARKAVGEMHDTDLDGRRIRCDMSGGVQT